jgi:ABC-2 type transport system permease protein
MEAFPPAVRQAFGVASLNTMEGFLSAELYAFGWVLLLGLYFAYAAAGLVADDVERGRMDLLLSLPVRRRRVVAEAYTSLLVPIAVLNVVVPVVVYVATALVDAPVDPVDLVVVHALSVPYFLATAGLGLLASVVADRVSVAQRAALGVLFGLFLVDSVAAGTDYDALGALAPMRYYDPTAVLVEGSYDLAGAALLLAAAAVLVAASALWFGRRDVA